jgi:hypothetical protein
VICKPTITPPHASLPPRAPPAAPDTQLVKVAATPYVLTTRRECDCRGALARGLAEYLTGLRADGPGGTSLRFQRAVDIWADPTEIAEYPSVVVKSDSAGSYAPLQMSPQVDRRNLLADGRYLVLLSNYATEFTLEVWCNDKRQRSVIAMMLEEELCPVEWMYGFKLNLPHYWGLRGSYEPLGSSYVEDPLAAMQGLWKFTTKLHATIPHVRPLGLPEASPRAVVEMVESVAEVRDTT